MQDDNCRFKEIDVGATAKGFTNIESGDEKALQSAVATVGPIAVGIDVKRSFQLYRSGMYVRTSGNSTTKLFIGSPAVTFSIHALYIMNCITTLD